MQLRMHASDEVRLKEQTSDGVHLRQYSTHSYMHSANDRVQ